MALKVFDLVAETTTTTGTGTITLGGAVSGYRAFGASGILASGDTTYYAIALGADFEVGLGTYTASGNTLARTTVLASSNASGLVNFPAGTKTVRMTFPAALLAAILPSNVAQFAGLNIEDQMNTVIAGRGFSIHAKDGATYPVVMLRPTTVDKTMTLDISPNGNGGNYPVWIDMSDEDLESGIDGFRVCRVGIRKTGGARFSSYGFGTKSSTPPDLEMAIQEVVKMRITPIGVLIGSPTVKPTLNGYHTYFPNDTSDDVNAAFYSNSVSAGFGTISAHPIYFIVGNAVRWIFDTAGNLYPAGATKTSSLGSATKFLLNLFTSAITFSSTAPASATDAAGNVGEIRVVGAFVYIKSAANTWVRLQGSTF